MAKSAPTGGEVIPDDSKTRIDILLAEYQSVRADVSQAMQMQTAIIAMGVGGIIALMGKGNYSRLRWLGISVVSLLTLILREREKIRWKRGSWYMWGLERKINYLAQARVMEWEHSLRNYVKQPPPMKSAEIIPESITILIILFTTFSIFWTSYLLLKDGVPPELKTLSFDSYLLLILAFLVTLAIWYSVRWSREKYENAGKWPTECSKSPWDGGKKCP